MADLNSPSNNSSSGNTENSSDKTLPRDNSRINQNSNNNSCDANYTYENFQQAQYHDTSVPVTPIHEAGSSHHYVKTFLFGFLGAAVACIIALIIYFAFSPSQSSTVLGSSDSSSFSVEGEDITLAQAVAEKALPSVVNIDVYSDTTSLFPYGASEETSSDSSATSLGSGVILSSDGYILTNYHVIEDGSKFIVRANATEYEASVVGTDESSDLAVLKVDASDLTPIEIGSSADLVVGEWVMAVGSPFGLEQSVSTGIVSATSRSAAIDESSTSGTTTVYANLIQTDAAINPGNSGGALVDSNGTLIGINTLIASSSGSSSGVGFAIPVDYAIDIAQQIIDGKEPSHAQLGITMSTITDQLASRYDLSVESGVYVNSVVEGSGAAKAGIQQGDIITAVDGTTISDSSELMIAVRSHAIGDTITITYIRDGQENTVDVTLGSDA